MKKANYLFYIICASLIAIAVLGLFENRALSFVTDVSKKNLSFMGMVAEIKLTMASVSTSDVPFLSGETAEISKTLDKAENYLFYVNIISVVQVMVLTISKSIFIKIGMGVLFLLCFVKQTKMVCSKLLIITLALNPGLSLYSVAVQQLSKEASIDFGDSYQKELNNIVTQIKSEKAQLMQEHDKALTQINNGDKGIIVLRRLKENISYDVKKVKANITGDYKQIRLLLKDAGHDLFRKLFIFCTTILFCLLIMPLGYSLFVYVTYKAVYKKNFLTTVEADVEQAIQEGKQKRTLLGKVTAAAKAASDEFKNSNTLNEIKNDASALMNNGDLKKTVTDDLNKLNINPAEITSEISNTATNLANNLTKKEDVIVDTVQKVTDTVSNAVAGDLNTIGNANDTLSALGNLIKSGKLSAEDVLNKIRTTAAEIQSQQNNLSSNDNKKVITV